MGFLKQHGNTILGGLVELLIGILLFVDPIGFPSGILKIVGVILLFFGLFYLLRYFTTEPVQAALEQNFSKGMLMILMGGVLALWTEYVMGLFPLLAQLYGIAILVLGVVKLQQGVDLLRMKARFWFLAGINALLAIAFATVILLNPFTSVIILWQVAAVSLIVEAVLDIVVLIVTRKKAGDGE